MGRGQVLEARVYFQGQGLRVQRQGFTSKGVVGVESKLEARVYFQGRGGCGYKNCFHRIAH